MAIGYDIDIQNIEIFWHSEAGWSRRMARVTFAVTGVPGVLPSFELPILLDAQLKPDAELAPRAWASLHERLAQLQEATTAGESLSKTAVQRGLREG